MLLDLLLLALRVQALPLSLQLPMLGSLLPSLLDHVDLLLRSLIEDLVDFLGLLEGKQSHALGERLTVFVELHAINVLAVVASCLVSHEGHLAAHFLGAPLLLFTLLAFALFSFLALFLLLYAFDPLLLLALSLLTLFNGPYVGAHNLLRVAPPLQHSLVAFVEVAIELLETLASG